MLVIFDWDGTVVDSKSHIVKAMQMAITELNWTNPSDDYCAQMIGLGLTQTALALFPNIDLKDCDRFAKLYSTFFSELKATEGGTIYFPTVLDTFSKLVNKGHQLAIATGKSRRGLNQALEADQLNKFFIATKTADEAFSKPNPTMLIEILNETNTIVSEAIMVGDTTYDMQMAHSIGMHRVAVTYGMHSIEQMSPYKPFAFIDRMSNIIDCINKIENSF